MAPRKATPAPPEPTKRAGRAPMGLDDYLTKPATSTQTQFADWLIETVGYAPTLAKTKADAFRDGVRLAVGMRIAFQTSPEAQAVLAEKRAANGRPAVKATPAKKTTAAPAKAAKATATASATKPAKTAPAKASKTTPAKATATRGRPPAAKAATAPPTKAAKSAATKPAKAAATKAAPAKATATTPPRARPAKRATAKVTAPPPPPPANTVHISDDDVPF